MRIFPASVNLSNYPGRGYQYQTGDGWGYAYGLGDGNGNGPSTVFGFHHGNGYNDYPLTLIQYWGQIK